MKIRILIVSYIFLLFSVAPTIPDARCTELVELPNGTTLIYSIPAGYKPASTDEIRIINNQFTVDESLYQTIAYVTPVDSPKAVNAPDHIDFIAIQIPITYSPELSEREKQHMLALNTDVTHFLSSMQMAETYKICTSYETRVENAQIRENNIKSTQRPESSTLTEAVTWIEIANSASPCRKYFNSHFAQWDGSEKLPIIITIGEYYIELWDFYLFPQKASDIIKSMDIRAQ